MQNPVLLLRRIPVKTRLALLAVLVAGATLFGLRHQGQAGTETFQGYVEAEYVHVAAPVAGALSELRVRRASHFQQASPQNSNIRLTLCPQKVYP